MKRIYFPQYEVPPYIGLLVRRTYDAHDYIVFQKLRDRTLPDYLFDLVTRFRWSQ